MLADQLQPPWQRDPTLTAPAADEIVGGTQVEVGESGDAAGTQPGTQGPPAHRGRGDGEHGGVEHGGVEHGGVSSAPCSASCASSSAAAARASTSHAAASRASPSSRNCAAVRASASATPPPSTSSSSGSTSLRRRTRVKRGSTLCGSSQKVRPCDRHAAAVSARRRPSSGRSQGGSQVRMPARDRAPEPRPRPSSTVSAWSSRVWPSRTGESGCGRAVRSAPYRTRRAAASRPPPPSTTTPCTAAGTPWATRSATSAALRSAEPSCNPWSITATCTRPGATARAAASRAVESAPPEHATSSGAARTGAGSASSACRTARRTAATAGTWATGVSGEDPATHLPSHARAACGVRAVHSGRVTTLAGPGRAPCTQVLRLGAAPALRFSSSGRTPSGSAPPAYRSAARSAR